LILSSDRHAQIYQDIFGVYGCLRHGRHARRLGNTQYGGIPCRDARQEACGVVSGEALAGTVVAYVESRLESSGRPPDRIVVRSIVTGRVLHVVSLDVATREATFLEEARTIDIAVEGNGAVAWIQEDSFARHGGGLSPPTVYDLFAIDSHGFHALSIDLPAAPRSLKLEDGVVVWTQEGTPHSATLN
jgi:hypothetical protein